MPSYDFSESDRAARLGWRVYTRTQIAQLYAAHRRGDYAGKEMQWRRQEIDLVRAIREGRVTGGITNFDK
jgi:hypothetical protein